jgi:hypothetical protein
VADTGAPWNIPYAEPTDLVRDWPDLSEDVADAVAAGLTAAGNAGIGSNVVQTVKTDLFATTSTTYVDITGLAVTITPTTNTSKVLVICHIQGGNSTTNIGRIRLMRNSTAINQSTGGTSENMTTMFATNDSGSILSRTIVFVDSPGTISATTYKAQMFIGGGGTVFLNRRGSNDQLGVVSSITAIEVAP